MVSVDVKHHERTVKEKASLMNTMPTSDKYKMTEYASYMRASNKLHVHA